MEPSEAYQQPSVEGPAPFPTTNPVLSPPGKKTVPLDDRTRLKRNASEKKRRDKLNTYIHELSAMVPSCSMPQSQRKLDKSTILKLTVSYMKLHADLLPECVDNKNLSWKPAFLSNEELGQLMLEALDGFLFVISYTGQIVYMSESITPLLGHLQNEIVGKDFLQLVHPEDIIGVQEKMFPPSRNGADNGYIEELGAATASSPTSVPSPGSIPSPGTAAAAGPSHLRRQFHARMKRGGFTNKPTYELVYCSGHLRKWSEVVRNTKVEGEPDPFPQEGTCLVGVGRLQSTQTIREMSPSVPPKNEWTSQHNMEAKYLFVDDRAASIIGYSSNELLGSNGYNFYHHEDLRALSQCHVDLNVHGIGTTCYYRFLTKGQQWLWIQTKGTVVYKNGSKTPSFIVTHNTVVSYAQVWEYLQKRAKQYGPDAPSTGPLPLTGPETKQEIMPLEDIKIESPYSPAYGQIPPQSLPSLYNTNPTNYYADMPPAETLIFPKKLAPKTYNMQPSTSTTNFTTVYSLDKPEPIIDDFSTTGSATFADLYPNYKPSLSTHETHGTYKEFKPLNHQPYCNELYHNNQQPTVYPAQKMNKSTTLLSPTQQLNNKSTTLLSQIPNHVYHLPQQSSQPRQQYVPTTNNYVPNTTGYISPNTTFPASSTSINYPPITTNYSTITNYNVPNVAVTSNGSTGCAISQPILGKAVPHMEPVYLSTSPSPPPKKGVSVYGGEKRCLSPHNNLSSCAQVEHSNKRPRSDPPQYLPPYIKPAVTPCYTQPYSYQPMLRNDNMIHHDNNYNHIKNGGQIHPGDNLVSIDTGQHKINNPH